MRFARSLSDKGDGSVTAVAIYDAMHRWTYKRIFPPTGPPRTPPVGRAHKLEDLKKYPCHFSFVAESSFPPD